MDLDLGMGRSLQGVLAVSRLLSSLQHLSHSHTPVPQNRQDLPEAHLNTPLPQSQLGLLEVRMRQGQGLHILAHHPQPYNTLEPQFQLLRLEDLHRHTRLVLVT